MNTLESIVLSFDNHIKSTNTQYSDWCIGVRATNLAVVLAKTNSIELTSTFECTFNTAQKVLDHFVSKGMERDSKISTNAAKGVFIYRRNS